MRYALRNQNKIKESLGSDLLHRILNSLKQSFDLYGEIIESQFEYIDGHQYPILTINDASNTSNLISFYVIGKRYNVYHLAFKEFIE